MDFTLVFLGFGIHWTVMDIRRFEFEVLPRQSTYESKIHVYNYVNKSAFTLLFSFGIYRYFRKWTNISQVKLPLQTREYTYENYDGKIRKFSKSYFPYSVSKEKGSNSRVYSNLLVGNILKPLNQQFRENQFLKNSPYETIRNRKAY